MTELINGVITKERDHWVANVSAPVLVSVSVRKLEGNTHHNVDRVIFEVAVDLCGGEGKLEHVLRAGRVAKHGEAYYSERSR